MADGARAMYGSATSFIPIALMTRVCTPAFSRASWSARAFMTVASIRCSRRWRGPFLGRRREPAKDVAPADDDADLDAEPVDLGDLSRDECAEVRIDTVLPGPQKGLARQLQ